MLNLLSSAGGVPAGARAPGPAHPHLTAADSNQRHRGEAETESNGAAQGHMVQNSNIDVLNLCTAHRLITVKRRDVI